MGGGCYWLQWRTWNGQGQVEQRVQGRYNWRIVERHRASWCFRGRAQTTHWWPHDTWHALTAGCNTCRRCRRHLGTGPLRSVLSRASKQNPGFWKAQTLHQAASAQSRWNACHPLNTSVCLGQNLAQPLPTYGWCSVLKLRWACYWEGGGGGLQAVLSQAGTLNVANLFTDLIRWIEPSQI